MARNDSPPSTDQPAGDPAPALALRQRRKSVQRAETEAKAPIGGTITTLRVPAYLRDGTQDVIDLTDTEAYGCRPLGEALARAIGQLCGLGDNIRTLGTLKHYKRALRDIIRFNAALPAERRATAPEKITSDWILDFQNSMIVPGQCESTIGQKWRRVRMLLRQIHASTAALNKDAQAYLYDGNIDLPNTAGLVEAGKVEPYSYEEAVSIERYFEDQVRGTIARLKRGHEMIANGQDPREHGWRRIENQLWYLANVLNFQPLTKEEWLNISGLDYRFFNLRKLHAHVFPGRNDIAAIYFLILARTGINADSLMKLKIPDIFDTQKGVMRLDLEKLRAFGQEERQVVVRTESWRNAGGLLRICLKITEHIRPWIQDDDPDRDAVFIFQATPNSSNSKPVISLKEGNRLIVAHDINRTNAIKNADGTPIKFVARRLRPTHKTRRYLSRQSLEAAGYDHRNLDTTVPYVANAVTLPIHEKTVAQAQRKLIVSFIGTVVSEGGDDPDAVAKAVGCGAEVAKEIAEGAADVFLSSCKDFYNRPGGKPNTPCDKAWSCYECANAVITSRALPRVFRFLDHMLSQRKALAESDWNGKFGLPYRIVTEAILPSFPDEVIEAARLASAEASFYLPIHMKQK